MLLSPLVLMLSLWIVARKEADLSFFKLFFVSLGLGVGTSLLDQYLLPIINGFVYVIDLFIAIAVLVNFCHIDFIQALKTLVLYCGIYYVIGILLGKMFS